ncbi:hypothetical protein HMPREF7545_0335 [Selenomonas noxia ATCC 43541]|uniref:hypothetical protein n=1 Tax=Selenomonas noxia TaxID=135083 RepID=UPI0001CEBAB8|nr:hypothetical protein [Selenomonas noxia]EFF66978.1 hypothetical protein HMPREF7545_0335 [Selenomonas noxia ATCC 43541]
MKFDRELFDAICEEYGVEFSEAYDCPMLEEADGSVHPLGEDDVKRMFSSHKYNIDHECVFENSDSMAVAC